MRMRGRWIRGPRGWVVRRSGVGRRLLGFGRGSYLLGESQSVSYVTWPKKQERGG